MKWIGQHIWDWASRFRNDVYLEDIATGTIASGGNLGLDSNNKIVKASASGGIAFDGSTANGILTYKDSDEATVESNLTFDGSTLSLTGGLSVTGDTVTFTSANADDPVLTVQNTTNDAQAARLQFVKNRGAAGQDNDNVAELDFYSYNDAGTPEQQQYGRIVCKVDDATDGQEGGSIQMFVATHDGSLRRFLLGIGGSVSSETDVTIANGAASVTTIAGTLTMGTTATLDNDGILQTAAQTNITSLGTLTALDIDSVNINDKSIVITGDTSDTFTITTGAAGATTLTTVDDAAAAGHFEIAADGNITLDAAGDIALECGGSDLTCDARSNTFTNGAASSPTVTLKNTANDATGAQIEFRKDKGAAAADGDDIGTIVFKGDNTAEELTDYASIVAEISEADDTDEAGKLTLNVAESNGTASQLSPGLILEGEHATDGQVDVTIANGAASTTTISGTLTMGSTAAMTNAGLLSVANQSNITGVGTISSGTWQGTSIATTYTAAKVTSIVAGDGIDVSGATGDVTVTAETATDSNPGVVELATTGEADTGTDTARAVTPAGLKSHVDARYASSYISFLGQATMDSDGNWIMCNKTGISNHTWNLDSGVNTETNDSTQATIARQWAHTGIRMPAACVIAGMNCLISNAGGNRQVTVGLFCSRATDSTLPDWGGNGGAEPKLQMHADASYSGGSGTNYSGRPSYADATGTVAMAAGDIFYPAIKLTGVTSGGNTDNVYASFTVHIKTLIS